MGLGSGQKTGVHRTMGYKCSKKGGGPCLPGTVLEREGVQDQGAGH
jgi:hypothetical protein